MQKQKLALFHPWIKSKGGAEKVVLELTKLKNFEVDVYTWIYMPEKTFEGFKELKIKVIAPKIAGKISRNYLLRGLFFPISIFSKIPLNKYDKFLISSSGVGEFITFRNYKKGKTYAYIHTPLRAANKKIMDWNLENRDWGFMKKMIYRLSVLIYIFLERIAWKKIDLAIFNSELSRKRAREHNLLKNKKSEIVNPPINFSFFEKVGGKEGKSFVYISRFNPPKRQDVLIEAWKKFHINWPEYKLILIGTPEDKKYSEKINKMCAGEDSIEIRSNLDDVEFSRILGGSMAGIFLGYQEDFGIVPLEILAMGKPLLGVVEGGYVELIKKSPLFFPIKEMTENSKMILEVEKVLENFVNTYKKSLEKVPLRKNNFLKKMGRIIFS